MNQPQTKFLCKLGSRDPIVIYSEYIFHRGAPTNWFIVYWNDFACSASRRYPLLFSRTIEHYGVYVPFKYHVHIWKVSRQISPSDTYDLFSMNVTRSKHINLYFLRNKNVACGEITNEAHCMRSRQNGHHFTNVFKFIFFIWNVLYFHTDLLKLSPVF